MKWINELPLEHTSSNGTTFKAVRSDLKGPVTVSFPSWPLTEEQKREDFLQFGTWRRGCIFKQLNGFSGYDRICFVYSTGTTTGRISSREPAISAKPKSGTLAEPSSATEPVGAREITQQDLGIKRQAVNAAYDLHGFPSAQYDLEFDELHTLNLGYMAQQYRKERGLPPGGKTPYCPD